MAAAGETLQQTLRRQLLADAAAGSAAFECSGSIPLHAPLKLFFEDAAGAQRAVTFPPAAPGDLQPLLNAMSPAAFGRGGETLHDPAVRTALQMPAARFRFEGGGPRFPSAAPAASLLEHVQQRMMPQGLQAGMTVEAECYALNVYCAGGFFKAHQDTPRSDDMFGSLVVCLLVEHSGGTLVVRTPTLRSEVRHDWGGPGLLEGPAGRLAWTAFYSGCEHEVLPVASGHRVTLTFNLYQRAPSPPLIAPPASEDSAFGQQLAAALQDATWYPAGIKLGLVLEHMYAVEKPKDAVPSSPIKPEMLKGADLQLYEAATTLGLTARIMAVYKMPGGYDGEDEEEEEEALPTGPHSDLAVGPWGSGGPDLWDQDEESEAAFLQRCHSAERDKTGSSIVWIKPPGQQHLVYKAKAEAWGKDGHTTHWYVAAALMIDVPAADAPCRVAA